MTRRVGSFRNRSSAFFLVNTSLLLVLETRTIRLRGQVLRKRQAHIPIRQQHEATGHAVRDVYLYAGMADAAFENDDTELMDLCDELFDDITTRKMYITGGIGCRIPGEGLGSAYELPLNRAYAESCAAMGLVQFAARLLKYRGNVKYVDIIERLICNGATRINLLSSFLIISNTFPMMLIFVTSASNCHVSIFLLFFHDIFQKKSKMRLDKLQNDSKVILTRVKIQDRYSG